MRPLLGLTIVGGLIASGSVPRAATPAAPNRSGSPPFQVGERLTYQAKLNFINAGSATMSVQDVEPVRGRPTYHTVFELKGRVLLFHVDDHYESWFDTTDLVSLRHIQHIDETKYSTDKTYDFY